MRAISIADNGTTIIEFTKAEGREMRDALTTVGGVAPTTLQRLLAMAHGETDES